ncbi:hypothetical protein W97_08277 [Coniosporium apollinis CBS 100218]|uniref:Type II secretion system protein n=1 Tax=Coniosporium apollinis (strain CBS 100218) TaxID=1168221 RepID=R7Z4S5_CONA1|nr:uncharacterized protein W97_08277 [Coniosporium apollinis CBS 100218]EON69019.1 hypothetical protein W97_08277 [Coniosporium apollinis CBS 100218]
MVLSLFFGGIITAIPVVTGVAEGVSHQNKQNAEAAELAKRMIKFHLDVFCDAKPSVRDKVHGMTVVLKNDGLYLAPKDDAGNPLPTANDNGKATHPFMGFYIDYPDPELHPDTRGLVSTISLDPPMLNWIYMDKETQELKYGNRTQSREHIVGPWDWTSDEPGSGLTLDEWEGFVAVEEVNEKGKLTGEWTMYYDHYDNGLKGKVEGRRTLECRLERRICADEMQLEQNQVNVKTRGNIGVVDQSVRK